MIARVWQARIDSSRAAEYDTFAQTRSLPTFQAQRGFRGCAFLGDGAQRIVLTLWDGKDNVEALERSAQYRELVADIMRSGFILDTTPVITAGVQGSA
jgi:hypothetical protein